MCPSGVHVCDFLGSGGGAVSHIALRELRRCLSHRGVLVSWFLASLCAHLWRAPLLRAWRLGVHARGLFGWLGERWHFYLTSWLGQMKSLTFTGCVVVSLAPLPCRGCCCCWWWWWWCCWCACLGGFWRGLRFLSFRLLPCFGFLLLDARVWKPSRLFAARRFTRVRRPALVLRVSRAISVRDFSSFWVSRNSAPVGRLGGAGSCS